MTFSQRLLALTSLALGLTVASAADAQSGTKKTASADPNIPKWKKVLPAYPADLTCTTNVIAEYPEHTVTIVIYTPKEPGIYPAVLDIHGGGWSARQVEADKPMMEKIAQHGFVTAIVAYRLSGEAKYPAALDDCKSAVRYLRANAAKFRLNPEHIGVMGGSAGGHLSGLLAMTSGKPEFEGKGPNPDFSSTVQACIVMAATQDLYAANHGKNSTNSVAFFGVNCDENPELYKQASPITHVRAGVPPTIFIEGERDSLKIGREEMQDKLRALDIETALYTLKYAPHPFWMSQPWCDETVGIATTFFKKHLGEPATAKP